MRTLSRAESGLSNCQVSLDSLLDADTSYDFSNLSERNYSIDEVVQQLIKGGWPNLIMESSENASIFQRDYIALTAEIDISRIDGVKRDPAKVRKLLQSYARNIATQAAISSITEDVKGDDVSFTQTTAYSYIEALEKLMIIEDLPAWNTHVRSTVARRTTPKRHFVDPSLAIGALHLSAEDLLNDLEYTGFLFESSVIRDLRVYADVIGAEVSFFRDAKGREVDAIVQKANDSWAGFEIKLGDRRIDEGAESLLRIKEILDFKKVKRPSSLNVITSGGFPYRRSDDINVIPISTLTA
jgi:predicted AAA+ superfamily ATPase